MKTKAHEGTDFRPLQYKRSDKSKTNREMKFMHDKKNILSHLATFSKYPLFKNVNTDPLNLLTFQQREGETRKENQK